MRTTLSTIAVTALPILVSPAAAGKIAPESQPQFCVSAGQVVKVDVRFRAAFQNILELRVGDRLLRRFDNWFDRGTPADQGAGVWTLPAFKRSTCIAVTSFSRPGGVGRWRTNLPKQTANWIGFEDDVDADYDDAEIRFSVQAPTS